MKTPTAEVVTQRLRRLAELSRTTAIRSGLDYGVDAVTARLREMSDLSRFCAELVELGRRDRSRRSKP
jgi:hypothetical protein